MVVKQHAIAYGGISKTMTFPLVCHSLLITSPRPRRKFATVKYGNGRPAVVCERIDDLYVLDFSVFGVPVDSTTGSPHLAKIGIALYNVSLRLLLSYRVVLKVES